MAKITAYFQLTRPLNLLIAFLSIFMGGLVTGTVHPLEKLLLACVSGILIMAGANTINDVYDIEIDRINKPARPLPSGKIDRGSARIFSLFLLALGCISGLLVNKTLFAIAVLSSVLVYFYSSHLKRTALWGNLTVAVVTGLAFIYGGLAVGRTGKALIVGMFAFLFHLGREIIKDIEDREGDRVQGLRTLPIRGGVRCALIWATAVLSLLIFLSVLPYVFGYFKLPYLLIVVIGVDFFLVYAIAAIWKNQEPSHLGKIALWMKFDMFVGLLAVFFGN